MFRSWSLLTLLKAEITYFLKRLAFFPAFMASSALLMVIIMASIALRPFLEPY